MRVTVVFSVCVSVKSHLMRLFVLKILSHTQRATMVKKICRGLSETALLQKSSTPSIESHKRFSFALSVAVVISVRVSVKSHLTSVASVRSENTA